MSSDITKEERLNHIEEANYFCDEMLKKDITPSYSLYTVEAIIFLISELRSAWEREKITEEALGKMANHNERLAMKDRPALTMEGWSVDKAFSLLAEEALTKIRAGRESK